MQQQNQPPQSNTDLAVKEYKPNLLNALKTGNKTGVTLSLRDFKQPNGTVNYPALFKIPSDSRLPKLAEQDFGSTLSIVTAGITLAFENMNLIRGMNNSQIIDLAETVLDSSNEDNLSLEDLMLFLQKMTRGEYGKLYESMDVPKFMEMFEIYRQERFQEIINIREEQAAQHKAIPVNDRIIDLFNTEKGKHREALKDYLTKK